MLTYAPGWDQEKVMQRIYERNGFEQCVQSGSCTYRKESLNGKVTNCYIGAFIPEEEYNPDFENKTVEQLIWAFPYLNKFMPFVIELGGSKAQRDLLAFQDLHDYDTTSTPEEREMKLKEFLENRVFNNE